MGEGDDGDSDGVRCFPFFFLRLSTFVSLSTFHAAFFKVFPFRKLRQRLSRRRCHHRRCLPLALASLGVSKQSSSQGEKLKL